MKRNRLLMKTDKKKDKKRVNIIIKENRIIETIINQHKRIIVCV